MYELIKQINSDENNLLTVQVTDDNIIAVFQKQYEVDTTKVPPVINELPSQLIGSFSKSELEDQISVLTSFKNSTHWK